MKTSINLSYSSKFSLISFNLINEGVKTIFLKFFPEISKLQKPNQSNDYDQIIAWFVENNTELFIGDEFSNKEYQNAINDVIPINKLIKNYCKSEKDEDLLFIKEILLWGLTSFNKLSKNRMLDGIEFKDSLGTYLEDLNS